MTKELEALFYLSGDNTLETKDLANLVNRNEGHVRKVISNLLSKNLLRKSGGSRHLTQKGLDALQKHFG